MATWESWLFRLSVTQETAGSSPAVVAINIMDMLTSEMRLVHQMQICETGMSDKAMISCTMICVVGSIPTISLNGYIGELVNPSDCLSEDRGFESHCNRLSPCGVTASTTALQAVDTGSIPVTGSALITGV